MQTVAAVQFHLMSFEGPDPYARAGGIASRITDLSSALAHSGFETHLWFVGDPWMEGSERHGALHLHRWCQWISRHHPRGVYDGEEGKCRDYAGSLPAHLWSQQLEPHLRAGGRAVVLAEEWHTVDAVLHLDHLLRTAGVRDRVLILWNANNLFGFERIDWDRLRRAAVITTVSRYMKHRMWSQAVDPVAIPNGISLEAFERPRPAHAQRWRAQFAERLVLAKVARFDPDKRWLSAVEIVARLKVRGLRPLLVARGGIEAHGREVLGRAAQLGLRVAERRADSAGAADLLDALSQHAEWDVLHLTTHLDGPARRLLYAESAAVLCNSGHEPFGLVGLETMAVEGLACTGSTGEEYAELGRNAVVLQSDDPMEFVGLFLGLCADPIAERALRRRGRASARLYLWPKLLRRHLLPAIEFYGGEALRADLAPTLLRASAPAPDGLSAAATLDLEHARAPESRWLPVGREPSNPPRRRIPKARQQAGRR